MRISIAITGLVLLIFFLYAIAKRCQTIKNKLFWTALIYHLVAGISVGMIYLYYYSANDTWLFFKDASRLSELAQSDFLSYSKLLFDFGDKQNLPNLVTGDFRSLIFIKLLSLFCLVSGDNYWLCAVYFSVLSFGASWFMYRCVKDYFSDASPAAALAFLFFPSIVFWSSGIEKETLTLSALYLLSGAFLKIISGRKIEWSLWILLLIASFLLWSLKYYWAGVFFMAATASWMTLLFSGRHLLLKKYADAFFIFLFIFTGVAVSFLHPNFYFNRFLDVVVSNHDAFVSLSGDKALIHYYKMSPTIMSITLNSPWALFSGTFRPFIGEGQGLLGLAASLENLLLLTLFVTSVWGFKKRMHSQTNILFIAAVSYCIVLCVFLALSTPNLGTLSRYRIGFLPFLVFVFTYRNPLLIYVTRFF